MHFVKYLPFLLLPWWQTLADLKRTWMWSWAAGSRWSYPSRWRWTRRPSDGPSHLNHSVLLWKSGDNPQFCCNVQPWETLSQLFSLNLSLNLFNTPIVWKTPQLLGDALLQQKFNVVNYVGATRHFNFGRAIFNYFTSWIIRHQLITLSATF